MTIPASPEASELAAGLSAQRYAPRPRHRPGRSMAIGGVWSGRLAVRLLMALLAVSATAPLVARTAQAQPPLTELVRQVQPRVVKVYGAGGIAALEAYQSGFLVSPDGHIATVWSYVLDVDPVVVLDDGRRFESKIVGFEPQLELAVLKIDAGELPYFAFDPGIDPQPGDPVLAVSNLFGIAAGNEPASAMHGRISGQTTLEARRGVFQTAYAGPVYVLDLVANNPGAAGGALVDIQGRLIGMLGKELRDAATGVWLNYALPASTLRQAIGDIIAGRKTVNASPPERTLPRDLAHSLQTLGLVMIPNVLEKTPAYVDAVVPDSPADQAGLQTDDLVLLIGNHRIDSQLALEQALRAIDRRDPVPMTVQRGSRIVPLNLVP